MFFCRALFQLSFLAILAIFVVDCFIFGKTAKDCIAQSAARWGKASGSRVRCRGGSFHQVIGQTVQACAEKNNFSELEQLIFCKTSVFCKLLY